MQGAPASPLSPDTFPTREEMVFLSQSEASGEESGLFVREGALN
jgi:hypothetical protein